MTIAKILIVEDEPAIAQEIAYNLEDHGYEIVGIAHSSEKALDMIHKYRPDLALLDIHIKGSRNGIELAEIIKSKYQIPFIYITSFSDKETIKEAAHTMPEGYIVKPFKDDDIAPVVEVALIKKERSRNNGLPPLSLINTNILSSVTPAEYKVIELVWNGKKNAEIGSELFISVNTVKTHMNNIYRKLEVSSKPLLINKLRGF